jgi:glycine dehydrogenase subunit 1
MCLMGKAGLTEVARQSTTKAHYLANEIVKLPGYELLNDAPFFKEFAIKTPVKPGVIIEKLLSENIFAGIDLEPFGYKQAMLVAVTEKKSRTMLDEFVRSLKEVNNG